MYAMPSSISMAEKSFRKISFLIKKKIIIIHFVAKNETD